MADQAPARVPYDEFGMFADNAAEYGIVYEGPPVVRRESVPVEGGRQMSALVWGDGPPAMVLIHGGAQNAHTRPNGPYIPSIPPKARFTRRRSPVPWNEVEWG